MHQPIDQFQELNDFDIIDILHGVSKLAISKTRLDKNRRAINYLGRCDWGIHSPSQYESLLLTLRDFNDDLYNSCTPTARDMMDRALISEMLAGQRDVFTLLHLCNAAADEAEDRSGPSKGFYSSSYKTLSQSAKLRARSNIDPFLKRRLIKPPTVLGREDYVLHTEAAWHGGDACLAVARGQRRVVLVEFKSYVVDGRAFKSLEDIIIKLAESLCAEDKPSEFRLLPCSGYFHDSRGGRYGFVYELPRYLHLRHQDEFRQGGLGIRKPHSLQALLKQLREPIDLGTRFVIARQLVASLYVIHACGFMHKNIRPSSILFLPAESDDRSGGPSKSRRVALGKPYIMGWGFTRPDDIEFVPAAPPPPSGSNQRQDQLVRRDLVVTKDKDLGIYQHPQRLKYPYRPYKHGFDVYSLGLVLLEIGLWQSIESFVEGITDFTTEDFRGYLKERVVPDLRGQCGSIYEQVVQECLATRVDDEEIIEKTLVWDIAGKLWECKA